MQNNREEIGWDLLLTYFYLEYLLQCLFMGIIYYKVSTGVY